MVKNFYIPHLKNSNLFIYHYFILIFYILLIEKKSGAIKATRNKIII